MWENYFNYPPYSANVLGSERDGKLFEKTICMDAIHYAGKHYDIHNLYGYFQANVTYRTLAIIIPGNRPMVLSRSTFPGSGRFVSHVLGENLSTWKHLQASISAILKFNLFGIPFTGADICGSQLNTSQELCLRWMQLGAFYPFSRNHNSYYSKDQDPASFGNEFVKMINVALNTRYELLPYLYTLFHLAHTEGSTVARPLLHEFPQDKNTWDINYQFLWGPALLISPIVTEGETTVEVYFPPGIWYDFYKGSIVKEGNGGHMILMDEGYINLHVRGGHILPLQKPNTTTSLSRKQPIGLFVAPDESGSAKGLLFWDDGISYETQEHKTYLLVDIFYNKMNSKSVLFTNITLGNFPGARKIHFGYLKICNQPSHPTKIMINDRPLNSNRWKYEAEAQVLHLKKLERPITEKIVLTILYN